MFGYDRIRQHQSIYHKVETLILPSRQEASIFLPMRISSQNLPVFLKKHEIKLFSWIIFACLQTVKAYPSLNRFVLNNRLYQHRFYNISTLIKQDKSKPGNNSSAKLTFNLEDSPHTIQTTLNAEIEQIRHQQGTSTDGLFKMLGVLPIFLFKLVLWGARQLDKMDLLPNPIIRHDPLHSSLMIANLGSIQGQSVYHHLFNWGTISIFFAFGQLDEHGNLDLTFTIDERIAEGLLLFKALDYFKDILEHPDEYHR